jgi:hypothetical protein
MEVYSVPVHRIMSLARCGTDLGKRSISCRPKHEAGSDKCGRIQFAFPGGKRSETGRNQMRRHRPIYNLPRSRRTSGIGRINSGFKPEKHIELKSSAVKTLCLLGLAPKTMPRQAK